VLTIAVQPDLHNDYSLLEKIGDKVKIVRTRTIDPWRSYQKVKEIILKFPGGCLLNKVFSGLIYLFSLPDHMVGWVPFALPVAIKLDRKEKFDIIYTSSPPHSQQLIGWALKLLLRKRWVADLRDPVLDNVGNSEINRFDYFLLKQLEKKVLYNARVVVANTAAVRDSLLQKYPGCEVKLIYNSFDLDEFRDLPTDKFERFTVSHIGSIYQFRKVDHIFTAINNLGDTGIISPENFSLLFVGFNEPGLADEVRRFNVGKYVDIRNMVQHGEALKLMARSHLLLLIKGFGRNSGAQIPGKLFEYLGTGNKVLCIAPRESEAARIVLREQAGFVSGDDPRELEEILKGELEYHRNGGAKREQKNQIRKNSFSSQQMANKFHEIFQSI
jgi:glycosyltransferase involved in cell wall biosynthesis